MRLAAASLQSNLTCRSNQSILFDIKPDTVIVSPYLPHRNTFPRRIFFWREPLQHHVYRAADGKRLLSVHASPPSMSRDGYALAPDASQLAVMTREQIVVYSVPTK
jgi:hypothetical protein